MCLPDRTRRGVSLGHFKQRTHIGRRQCTVLIAALVVGCASTPQSTRLRASDFDVTVSEVVGQLSTSDFLAGRSPDSEQMRIVAREVENLTSDILTKSEMWMAIARVQGALPVSRLSQERSIVFQMPPEEIEDLRRAGFDSPLTPENRPTHSLTAVFRSATRSGSYKDKQYTDIRKEHYYLEYQITNLATRELDWTGSFEFAREATGLIVN